MALFVWKKRKRWDGAEIGEKRVVRKLILWPKMLGDEWRWLGIELVAQEHDRWTEYWCGHPHEVRVRGWRDIAWAVDKGAID